MDALRSPFFLQFLHAVCACVSLLHTPTGHPLAVKLSFLLHNCACPRVFLPCLRSKMGYRARDESKSSYLQAEDMWGSSMMGIRSTNSDRWTFRTAKEQTWPVLLNTLNKKTVNVRGLLYGHCWHLLTRVHGTNMPGLSYETRCWASTGKGGLQYIICAFADQGWCTPVCRSFQRFWHCGRSCG